MRGIVSWIALGIAIILGVANAVLIWVWAPLIYLDYEWARGREYKDALHMAVEVGRLDVVSALLALVAFVLGIFALVSFEYIRNRSEREAKIVADRTAKAVVAEHFKAADSGDSGRAPSPPQKRPVKDVDTTQAAEVPDETANS